MLDKVPHLVEYITKNLHKGHTFFGEERQRDSRGFFIGINPTDFEGPPEFHCKRTKKGVFHIAVDNRDIQTINHLVKCPLLNVNKLDGQGRTPLQLACDTKNPHLVKALLRSPTIDIDLKRLHSIHTFVTDAIKGCKPEMLELFMAKRTSTLDFSKFIPVPTYATAVDIDGKIHRLISEYLEDPEAMILKLRWKQQYPELMAATLFWAVVFLCDGYMDFRQIPSTGPPINYRKGKLRKFLRIVQRLPMELQMIMCNRALGLSRDLIPSNEREFVFKSLTDAQDNVLDLFEEEEEEEK